MIMIEHGLAITTTIRKATCFCPGGVSLSLWVGGGKQPLMPEVQCTLSHRQYMAPRVAAGMAGWMHSSYQQPQLSLLYLFTNLTNTQGQ